MSTESGKTGTVFIGATPIADITSWEFTKDAGTDRYGSSSTGGFKRTIPGTKLGSGTIEFKWDSAAASPITEGSVVTLLLGLNSTGGGATIGEKYTVPAVINSFRVKVDIDNGSATAGTAMFETDGAWTEPTLA